MSVRNFFFFLLNLPGLEPLTSPLRADHLTIVLICRPGRLLIITSNCTHVNMHVYMHVHMNVHMHVCRQVYMQHVYMQHVYMQHVYMHVHMHVCRYECVYQPLNHYV